MLPSSWSNEDRTFFPERTCHSAKPVDPDSALSLGDRSVTSRSQDRGRSTLRHPDRESATWETVTGENRIKCIDARRHRLRGPVGNRSRIGKPMLDECADGGISIRHSSAILARTYPEGKKGTCTNAAAGRAKASH